MQVNEEHLDFIIKTIASELPEANILLFGSRYNGSPKEYSDIDIAVENCREIPLNILTKISAEFSESDIPYKIDLVDLARVTPEFRDKILADHCRLND